MRKLSIDQQKKLILSVGTKGSQRPLSPVEVAQAIDVELQAGTAISEMALQCGLNDATMIKRFHRLMQLAPEIQHMIGWGKAPSTLSFTVASHIARISDPADQETLCKAALENDLSTDEVREIIQVVERAGLPIAQAIDGVLDLRPRQHRLYAFIGLITDRSLRVRLAGLGQQGRNELLKRLVPCLSATLPQWSGTLGTAKFTLVGATDFAEVLRGYPGGFDAFERALNELLGREVSEERE